MARGEEDEEEENSRQEEMGRRGERGSGAGTYYRVLVGAGNAQWWASLGAAIFAVGLILIALAYSTIQIISTVPSNYVGSAPSVGLEAYIVGVIVTAIGLVLMFYSRYKLARLSLVK